MNTLTETIQDFEYDVYNKITLFSKRLGEYKDLEDEDAETINMALRDIRKGLNSLMNFVAILEEDEEKNLEFTAIDNAYERE